VPSLNKAPAPTLVEVYCENNYDPLFTDKDMDLAKESERLEANSLQDE
jgi:hypothetical protein